MVITDHRSPRRPSRRSAVFRRRASHARRPRSGRPIASLASSGVRPRAASNKPRPGRTMPPPPPVPRRGPRGSAPRRPGRGRVAPSDQVARLFAPAVPADASSGHGSPRADRSALHPPQPWLQCQVLKPRERRLAPVPAPTLDLVKQPSALVLLAAKGAGVLEAVALAGDEEERAATAGHHPDEAPEGTGDQESGGGSDSGGTASSPSSHDEAHASEFSEASLLLARYCTGDPNDGVERADAVAALDTLIGIAKEYPDEEYVPAVSFRESLANPAFDLRDCDGALAGKLDQAVAEPN